MAKLSKQEKKAKAAVAKARKAIDAAIKAAKKADKSARKEAAELERKLEKGLAKTRNVLKPGKSGKTSTVTAAPKPTEPVQEPAEDPGQPRVTDDRARLAALPTDADPATAGAVSVDGEPGTSVAQPTLAQLRDQARAAGLSGFSRLNKADLTALLATK